MSLQDNLAAAQSATQTAKDAYDSAYAQLVAAQSAIDAAKPHMASLSAIEGYASTLDAEIRDEFNTLIAKARALF